MTSNSFDTISINVYTPGYKLYWSWIANRYIMAVMDGNEVVSIPIPQWMTPIARQKLNTSG